MDIVTYVHELMLGVQIPAKVCLLPGHCCFGLSLLLFLPWQILGFVFDKLSDIEHRLASGSSEKLQLGALVGTFQVAQQMIGDSAQ